jgi:DNA-binding protein Fis
VKPSGRPICPPICAPPWPPEATLEAMELFWIRHVPDRCGGNRTRAARQLGIHPSTLWSKLKEEK